METSGIKIKRTNQFANKYRKIKVILDNKLLFSISNNETKIANINEGKYILMAKLDWGMSEPQEINIEKGKIVNFELGSPIEINKNHTKYSYIRLAILFFGTFLGRLSGYSILFWIAILIPFIWIIRDIFFTKEKSVFYYITFGRKKYLYLKELESA